MPIANVDGSGTAVAITQPPNPSSMNEAAHDADLG
jgi:hypothetical protein